MKLSKRLLTIADLIDTKNARTMFKVMNEFKKVDALSTSVSSTEVENESTNNYESYDDGPTFFI